MARDKRAAGKAFVDNLLAKVPEADRAAVAAALQRDDILDLAGDGALRHDEFSRLADNLRAREEIVQRTAEEQSSWYRDNQKLLEEAAALKRAGGGRREPEEEPIVTQPQLKKEDIVATVAPIIGQIEQDGVRLMGRLSTIGVRHLHEFGEVLDAEQLMESAAKNKRTVDEEYNASVAERRQTRSAEALAKQIAEAEERGRKKGIEETIAAGGKQPYPVGESAPSTLAGLGAKPEDFSLTAVVNTFREAASTQR